MNCEVFFFFDILRINYKWKLCYGGEIYDLGFRKVWVELEIFVLFCDCRFIRLLFYRYV